MRLSTAVDKFYMSRRTSACFSGLTTQDFGAETWEVGAVLAARDPVGTSPRACFSRRAILTNALVPHDSVSCRICRICRRLRMMVYAPLRSFSHAHRSIALNRQLDLERVRVTTENMQQDVDRSSQIWPVNAETSDSTSGAEEPGVDELIHMSDQVINDRASVFFWFLNL